MDYRSVLSEVESWSIDDRIRVVQDVWDRIAEEGFDAELSAEAKAKLQRRIEELDRNPASAVPWAEAKERVLKRMRVCHDRIRMR